MATPRERAIRASLGVERRLRKVEDAQVRAIVSGLKDARAATLDRLAFATRSWDIAQARSVLAELERQLTLWGDATIRDLGAAFDVADDLGRELTASSLRAAGVVELGISPTVATEQVIVAQRTLPLLISGISEDTLADVSRILRRSVLLQQQPIDAMKSVGRVVGPTAKGPFRNASLRAEAIVRTELGRISQQSAYGSLNDYAVRFDASMGKQWVSYIDGRTRRAHIWANGQTRDKVTQPFLVGGERMLYPKDPRASPGNVVNCRCTMVPWKPGW